MESIDKLRKSSHLDDDKWTLEMGGIIYMYGSKPNDPNAINWGEQWRKIADEIEQEIAERYIELPVDADGVPVKLGDTIGEVDNCEFYTFTVEGYTSSLPNGEGELLLVDANDDVWNPRNCRHFKLRTIEDVLRDCCNEWNEHCGNDWESGVYAKYAEEIRGMMA